MGGWVGGLGRGERGGWNALLYVNARGVEVGGWVRGDVTCRSAIVSESPTK